MDRLIYISQQTQQRSHLDNIQIACEAGCTTIQLRIKNETPQILLQQAFEAKEICNRFEAQLFINDHPFIANAVHAYGVHVGKEDMQVQEALKTIATHQIVGATANTFEDIQQHALNGAHYIGLGPFRFTTTKEKLSPVLGLKGYTHILQQMKAAQVHLPVYAIGGIMEEDISAILTTGVHGIAVSGLISNASNPSLIVTRIRKILQDA
ncbi:thiamine-phosphate pyrophosphorylase [Chitinophaga skermanii]|uniref:Thiamine-phosphate synthase n=1 Tax=Chitinophaga skermanii TaxID=331697 RepID=A0A327QAT0_9BACT|nr:thiamine phosphate synthase [Chitinophaga skermanii]RAJ01540.1 thiamine-phosphate pyrophosphorylase [Chitinophaga skermanii]